MEYYVTRNPILNGIAFNWRRIVNECHHFWRINGQVGRNLALDLIVAGFDELVHNIAGTE